MRVIAVGAHPDDIELGAGATLLGHAAAGHHLTLVVLTTGERDERGALRRAEQDEAAARLGAEVVWGGWQGGHLPGGPEVVELIEAAARGAGVAYLPTPHDDHQEHVKAAAAALAACRRVPTVLRYEGPSTHGFSPGAYSDISEQIGAKRALVGCHRSQDRPGRADRGWVDALARARGLAGRVAEAEAFEIHRLRWSASGAL